MKNTLLQIKKKCNNIKIFACDFFSSGLGWIVIIIIALLFLFHDGCPWNKKSVHMKENVMYVKPASTVKDN